MTVINRVTTEKGWERVTPLDTAGRRALWMRVYRNAKSHPNLVTAIELCAGREGDDVMVEVLGDKARELHELLMAVQHGYSLDENAGLPGAPPTTGEKPAGAPTSRDRVILHAIARYDGITVLDLARETGF